MKRRHAEPGFPVRAIQARMIAPCGMNCATCVGHLREKNRCPGCNDLKRTPSSTYCRQCRLRNCTEQGHPNRFCGTCAAFPCRRLRQLDLRYRTKYGMSMIANLEAIRAFGIRKFVAQEKKKWACPGCGATLCVHRPECLRCGRAR